MVGTKDPHKRLYTDFNLQVKLPESFPPRYRASLLKAMDQCTVKRHLTEPPTLRSEILR